MTYVKESVRKKDSMALLLGKPVFLEDLSRKDALIVKVVRSPHANAVVEGVRTEGAKKGPGVGAV